MEYELPGWFDKDLVELLESKIDRSDIANRHRFLDWTVRQVFKCLPTFATGINTKKFKWKDIEEIIEENCSTMDYKPDLVIGIKSGGAFIANYVGQCLDMEDIHYMKISHYSDNSKSVVKSSVTSLKKQAVVKEKPYCALAGKKVLLVDDQAATGSTLIVGKEYFNEMNVKDVRTFCLFTRKFPVDYCTRKGLMVYTPWGKDA